MLDISGSDYKEKSVLKRVEKAALKRLEQTDIFTVDVVITDENEMRELNKSARNVDAVTDVLSFPNFDKLYPPKQKSDFSPFDFDGNRVTLGSIMICRNRAASQANEYGHTYERELGFLLCHGLLHLFGFDHIEKEDEEVMFTLQKEILGGIGLTR